MPDTQEPPPVPEVPSQALDQVLPDPAPLIPRAPDPRAPDPRRRGRARRRLARTRRPLPDAQAIVEVGLPELAPPYDDLPASATRTKRPRRLALAEPAAVGPPPAGAASRRTDTGPVPGAGAWPSQFAQVLAETLAGARSAEQLAPWTTQQARRRISQLGPMLGAGPRPKVRRIIVTSPVSGVLEMTAIIAVGSEVHAVAVRLEQPGSHSPGSDVGQGSRESPGAPGALTAAPASLRTARLRATAHWLCTAVEVA